MKIRRSFIYIYLIILALAFILTACSSDSDPGNRKPENQTSRPGRTSSEVLGESGNYGKAPGFVLEDLEGNTVDFSRYQGKVVIVDFWATWCPPCRMSIPHLVELYKDYANQGLEVVGISLDRGGKGPVNSFADKYSIPYTIVMGNADIVYNWRVGNGIPVHYLINRQGEIVDRIVGYVDKSILEKKIQKYL